LRNSHLTQKKKQKKVKAAEKWLKIAHRPSPRENSVPTYVMKEDTTGSNKPAALPASLEGGLFAIFLTPDQVP
jgi:hypothetical protein